MMLEPWYFKDLDRKVGEKKLKAVNNVSMDSSLRRCYFCIADDYG